MDLDLSQHRHWESLSQYIFDRYIALLSYRRTSIDFQKSCDWDKEGLVVLCAMYREHFASLLNDTDKDLDKRWNILFGCLVSS